MTHAGFIFKYLNCWKEQRGERDRGKTRGIEEIEERENNTINDSHSVGSAGHALGSNQNIFDVRS